MPYTPLSTQVAGGTASAAGWANVVKANFESMGPHLIVRKSSDESVVSSTVLQDDDALILPVLANEVWLFHLLLSAQTGAGGMKSSFSIPTSGEAQFALYDSQLGTGTQQARITTSDAQTVSYVSGLTAPRVFRLDGLFINAGTAGNVVFRWAQTTSNGAAAIVKANSTLWAVKLA